MERLVGIEEMQKHVKTGNIAAKIIQVSCQRAIEKTVTLLKI